MKRKARRVITDIHVDVYRCKRNKNFPNNRLPVLVYRKCLELPKIKSKAVKIVQHIFVRNKWKNSWQNGIYGFHHYHSNTHEGMVIVKGSARVMFGGPKGVISTLTEGDVIILPAGVGHKCIQHSDDFLCVGAYPGGKQFDMNYGKASELPSTKENIAAVPMPLKDPIFGNEGFLKSHWKTPSK